MSTRFLLDANVVSDYGNNRPWAKNIITKIDLYGQHRCFLSAITWHELMFGLMALGATRRSSLNALYNGFNLVPFERAAAIEAAKVRRAAGARSIEMADALLAGHAIAGGFTLVSRNVRHFAGIAGLHVVNWAA